MNTPTLDIPRIVPAKERKCHYYDKMKRAERLRLKKEKKR